MESEYFDPAYNANSVKYDIYDWVEAAVFAVVCIILIFTFVGRIVVVDGQSMEPTLQHGDRLISSRLFYTPQYGDIVVVTKPNTRNEPLIKRVIATGGQEIDIDFTNGLISIDGKAIDEPYISEPTSYKYDVDFPVVVPEGCVFVIGDNRNDSWDSRDSGVGMVDERYILGRVVFRVTPGDTRGNPDSYWK